MMSIYMSWLIRTLACFALVGCTTVVTVTITDTTPPTISAFTSSPSTVTTTSPITLTVTASDDVGVDRVEFYEFGNITPLTPVVKTSTGTYTLNISYTAAKNGNHTYTAKAFDAAGKVASSTVTVNVNIPDTTSPTVSLPSGPISVTTTSPITLTVTASDDVGVDRVEFYEDSSSIALTTITTRPFTYTFGYPAGSKGTHTYTAKAYDAAGNMATSGPTTVNVDIPVSVVLNWRTVSTGSSYTCALTTSDEAYCWGYNGYGQLGNGTTTNSSIPIAVLSSLKFKSISTGSSYTCALTTSDEAYCWGYNDRGQLGNGTTTNSSIPTAVSSGLTFKSISASWGHTCAIASSGAAYCWGWNGYGQLGDNTYTDRTVPTVVADASSGSLTFKSISAGIYHTCAIASSEAAYCWGWNGDGQLGDGTTTQRLVPTAVADASSGSLTFKSISAGYHTCAIASSEAAYCWGSNDKGRLGNGTTTNSSIPTAVSSGLTFKSISTNWGHTCALTTSSGAAYCWGWNDSNGQLGDDTIIDRSVPTAVSGGLTFQSISAGNLVSPNLIHTCAVTTGNKAYCWGWNGYGQFGNGTTMSSKTPVLVP